MFQVIVFLLQRDAEILLPPFLGLRCLNQILLINSVVIPGKIKNRHHIVYVVPGNKNNTTANNTMDPEMQRTPLMA